MMHYLYELKDKHIVSIDRKLEYQNDIEYIASKIINHGPEFVDHAISVIGMTINRNPYDDNTINACEKLIDVLNDGPCIRSINDLTTEQMSFAAKMLTAVYDCVTLGA